MTLTPEGHENWEEHGGRVVEQVGDFGEEARIAQRPILAQFVAQRAHGDVSAADLHTETDAKMEGKAGSLVPHISTLKQTPRWRVKRGC